MKAIALAISLLLLPQVALADLFLNNADFTYTAVDYDVTYTVKACSSGSDSTKVAVYSDLQAAPQSTDTPDDTKSVFADFNCPETQLQWKAPAIDLYQSYAKIDPDNTTFESNENNNDAGPLEVCVGPDVVIKTWTIDIVGASVTYKATVCNNGSMDAKKFRVGFWHDRSQEPPAAQMGDIFKGIALLEAGKCEDIQISGGLRPNGSFTAWARADSGDFVEECREANNPDGPLPYTLSNPDLDVVTFQAQTTDSSVSYTVKVCNQGTAAVSKFFVDVYFNWPTQAPTLGEPGDVVKPVTSLAPSACTTITFQRPSVAKGSYISYAYADPDDFISEPNEANNLSQPLTVQVGKVGDGGVTDGGNWVDNDGDGVGVGPGWVGVPDCDDSDADISPKATEDCNDSIDNDCDLTPNDGCPGVDCTDSDGDSFGVGSDCVLEDCDDNNKDLYPWAPEKCGDNKDDNCNKIADDGCTGRQCVDQDMDGYGVGKGCPGPQDCADSDPLVNPGVSGESGKTCGDGVDNDCDSVPDDGCNTSVDGDGDGASVGGGTKGQPDCDDKDPKIGPNQPETCGDKIDNDCDGTVDDGCPGVDCKDADGDGWGVGTDCVIPDCDDTDKAIHPWATETCGDSLDNDCDGTVDDGCSGVDCVDADYDGWGVGKDCKKADCDDTDGGISPWVKEICADGKDNNCNGAIDESCVICEDADGDTHGIGPKCTSWDCDDTDPNTYPGATEACDEVDNDCDGTVDNNCSGGDDGCGCRVVATVPGPGLPLLWILLGVALLLAAARRV